MRTTLRTAWTGRRERDLVASLKFRAMSSKKSSARRTVKSPLSTRELRDNLVRKPLGRGQRDDDREEEEEEEEVDLRASSRILRSVALQSPPRRFPTTSSPLDDGGDGGDADAAATPGVSMIAVAGGRKVAAKAAPSPATPKSAGGSGKRRNRASKGSVENSQEEEEEGEEDSDSDDPQPSGRVTRRRRISSPRRKADSFRKARRREEERIDTGDTSSSSSLFVLAVVVLVLAVSLAACSNLASVGYFVGRFNLLYSEVPDRLASDGYNRSVKMLKEDLVRLKGEFPHQERNSWNVVAASLKGILKEEPRQPSVLLLLGGPGAEDTANCLAARLASLAAGLLGRSGREAPAGHGAADFTSRASLHRQMEADLSAAGTFRMSRLELLPGSSAMALHAFCDNISAPYKRAAIVLTVQDEEVATPGGGGTPETLAERVLARSWSRDLNEDKVSPLLSRLTVSVVRVFPEEKVSCT